MPNPYDYNPSILELTKDEMVDQSNLTASQFLIWLGQMVHPDVPLYNMVHTFTIKGALDPDKFLEAFQALLDGSDALRTVIEIVDGVPQQQVRRNFSYPMPYLDFSSNLQAHTAFQKWLKARKVYIFKLETCLFDTVLLKLADQHYVWYLNQHHLIADVLSFSIVYKRMAEFYGLALAGRLEEAPVLPQYQDFIKYQRTYRQSSSFEKAKVYWQEKLAEPFEPTSLYGHTPLPEARPLAQRINLPLGKSRSEKLKKIAQKKEIRALTPDITLFQIFVTLLACYIYRVSGKQHITFGTPFHNRTTASFKETIGLFIHIYPFQLEIADDESFLSLFYKVREESYTFLRYAPLGTSSSEGQKAYNVLLNYINTSFQDFNGLPMEPEWIHPGYGDSHHSLRLQVHDFTACGSFTLFFDFHRDVLSEEQHSWAVQHFLMLLEGFLDDPTQPINRVDILADEERQRLMIETNQTRSIYPNDRTIIELFEAQVSNTPQAIAVVYEDQQLTYAELNRRANQLAHFLQKLGVGPDTLVGVFMERSLEMVISLYGILKAGGAYVPLDPEYPTDRIIFMIEDTEVSVLLTHERLAEKLSKTQNSVSKSQKQKLICLDSEWTTVSQESPVNPANDATAENLAYVIYTSGSTGQPKGVMNEHRGICNRLLWMQDAYSLTAEDRVLQKTPFSFDVSVWEFFWPLLFGARLVVAKPGGHKDCGYLVQLIVEQKITTIHFVPSMLQAFLLDENIETCQSLNRVICSGEALPYALQERFFARLEAELHNLYGPTEAAVDVTYWACQRESELTTVPIGLPVANTQLYLLDSQLQPVPIGMPGELHIGGVQVARGYFNRPGLTAEKFISDPFNTDPDARLYKTGDLARYLPDGNLVYLG
ncbi:MAG: amino acid adenylation domain-containing protein, partial [Desulfobacterales bacterium]